MTRGVEGLVGVVVPVLSLVPLDSDSVVARVVSLTSPPVADVRVTLWWLVVTLRNFAAVTGLEVVFSPVFSVTFKTVTLPSPPQVRRMAGADTTEILNGAPLVSSVADVILRSASNPIVEPVVERSVEERLVLENDVDGDMRRRRGRSADHSMGIFSGGLVSAACFGISLGPSL